MNFNLKSKTYNILTSPSQAMADIETVLEPGARIVGVLLTGAAAGDVAAFGLAIANVTATDIPIASAQLTPGVVQQTRQWWAGLNGRYNDTAVVQVATANTTQGWFPIAPAPHISELLAATLQNYRLRFTCATALSGQVIILYTTEGYNNYGDHA